MMYIDYYMYTMINHYEPDVNTIINHYIYRYKKQL